MAVSRTTFKKRSTAKKHRGAGRRVYKVDDGFRVSPECPRSGAKRRAVIQRRSKTRLVKEYDELATAVAKVRRRQMGDDSGDFVRVKIGWPDSNAPF